MFICAHKPFTPPEGDMYVPLQVGSALGEDLGMTRDDSGDNISTRNKSFCELTGIYWIWKNVTCDIAGICHYRRYFVYEDDFLKKEEIEKREVVNYRPGVGAGISAGVFGVVGATAGLTGVGRGLSAWH